MLRIRVLKRVVITGGTGGLGTAVSEKFREAGWEVTALGRSDLDLLDRKAVDSYFSSNPCDLLICAAGMIRDQRLERLDEENWEDVYRVNYEAAANCAMAALPSMAQRGEGHVVFISSYAAIRPAVGQAAYATAKAALLGLTKELASAWGGKRIRVNAVLPGFLETPMTATVSERRKEVVRDLHFLGKFNTPEAAAAFLLFMEEQMAWTSGQVFQLDSRP
jgi:3-oxoacyl-[acyl-carrier protein] reductase